MSEQSSKDRTGLCTFIFENGHHCNMPQTESELRLCYFHEKREAQRLVAKDAALKVSRYLATNLHTACDLSAAFAMLFRAGAQGHFDAKTVNSLTKLGHLMLKTHLLAKEEFLSAFEAEWPDIVAKSTAFNFVREAASSPAIPPDAAPADEADETRVTESQEEQEDQEVEEVEDEVKEKEAKEEEAEGTGREEEAKKVKRTRRGTRRERSRARAAAASSTASPASSNEDPSSLAGSTSDDPREEDSSEPATSDGDVPLLSRSQLLQLISRYNSHQSCEHP